MVQRYLGSGDIQETQLNAIKNDDIKTAIEY